MYRNRLRGHDRCTRLRRKMSKYFSRNAVPIASITRYPKIHLFFPLCLSANKKNRVLLIRWFARNFNSSRSRIIKTCNASLWFIQFLLFKIRFAHQFNKYQFKNYYSISVGRSLQYKQNYLFKFEFQVCRNCNYLFILFTLSFFFLS